MQLFLTLTTFTFPWAWTIPLHGAIYASLFEPVFFRKLFDRNAVFVFPDHLGVSFLASLDTVLAVDLSAILSVRMKNPIKERSTDAVFFPGAPEILRPSHIHESSGFARLSSLLSSAGPVLFDTSHD